LTNSGLVTKYVDVNNMVPVIFDDYRHHHRQVLFESPTFFDDDLVFFNSLTQEFYIFDLEGTWNEKNVNHPSLTAGKLFKEKQWLDELRVV
jgi:hypothetical protein